MQYLDTSFVVALAREESNSAAAEAYAASRPIGALAISLWTRVELASAVSREVRMGDVEAPAASRLLQQFDARMRYRWHIWDVDASDCADAFAFVSRFATGLRAGDALHLAVAKNHRAELLTLDRGMLKAAKMLGVSASHGIRLAP
ncbi:MAG: type II toxin-antitoxin system VapC family toxin [Casimicrobiaceae bacterium]